MGMKLYAGLGAAAASLYLLNHLGTRRGATRDEARRALPGDDLLPNAGVETTHAITIHAPAERIRPWLVQVGYHRGGWYTDSKLDQLSFDYFFKRIAPEDKKPERRPSALLYWPFLMLGEAVSPHLMLNGFKRRAEQSTLTGLEQSADRPQGPD